MNLYKFILLVVATYLLYYGFALLTDFLRNKSQNQLSTDTGNTFFIPDEDAQEKPVQVDSHSENSFTQPVSHNYFRYGNGIWQDPEVKDNDQSEDQKKTNVIQDMALDIIDPGGCSRTDDNLLTVPQKGTF